MSNYVISAVYEEFIKLLVFTGIVTTQYIKNTRFFTWAQPSVIKTAFRVTIFWVWIGLQVTRLFEMLFRLILNLPDKWLRVFSTMQLFNSTGQEIKIIEASDEHGKEISNKLKLYISHYWQNATDSTETNGFDIRRLFDMIHCSAVYCTFVLKNSKDSQGRIAPNKVWSHLYHFYVDYRTQCIGKKERKVYYREWIDDASDNCGDARDELLYGHLDFDPLVLNASDANHTAVNHIDHVNANHTDRIAMPELDISEILN